MGQTLDGRRPHGESYGMNLIRRPTRHQYRDYLIRAYNADVPYDQFIREHIAGDLLSEPRLNEKGFNDSVRGTGFCGLGKLSTPLLMSDKMKLTASTIKSMSWGKPFWG